MIKNAKNLIDESKNKAVQNNITVNEVLQNYMFERILERLSISEYKNNFILKGGVLLSSIMGIDTRTTMDMDTCLRGINLTEEQLYKVLKNILDTDVKDGVTFEIKNSKPIREDDEYGGLKYNILAKFDNIKVNLSIDIATGDVITPGEIEYNYKMMFEDKALKIMTYNIESIIAEKFQTIISRNVLNSRMKDFYDLYYLIKYSTFSKDDLRLAIEKTFDKRNTDIKLINSNISVIQESDLLQDLWKTYSQKHKYTKDIKFEDIIETIKKISKLITQK